MSMAGVEQFSFGVTNPILASVMAYVGCLLGLACAAHARTLPDKLARARWLLASAAAIGGAGIWLMHEMAMLGFEVAGSPIRFDLWLTIASLGIGITVLAGGIFLVGYGRRSTTRLLISGPLTGIGISLEHVAGLAAVRINGTFSANLRLVAASVVIAVVAATASLWFTLAARRGLHFLAAAAVMAVAVTGMHYTAMSALHAHIHGVPHTVPGVQPTTFVLPVLLMSIAALICLLFCALNIMGDDEFKLRVDRTVLDTPSSAQNVDGVQDTPPSGNGDWSPVPPSIRPSTHEWRQVRERNLDTPSRHAPQSEYGRIVEREH
jgi:NO-binding membrane sensor protein with MHYT domain